MTSPESGSREPLNEREYDLLLTLVRKRILQAMDAGIPDTDPSSLFRQGIYDKLEAARERLRSTPPQHADPEP